MRRAALRLVALGAAGALGVATPLSGAAFTASTANAGNTFGAAPDWTAPTVGAAVVERQGATSPGLVAQGGSYYVYAEVSDAGAPASGVSAVTADVSALNLGASSVTLSPGSWTLGGAAFNWRAGPLVADVALAAGAKGFSIRAADAAGNAQTATGFGVTVDNAPPAAADVQSANGGATVGRLEAGDTLTLTFSKAIDPGSIVPGWTGSPATGAVVRLTRGLAGANTVLTFYDSANLIQLPLGSVDLGRNDWSNGNLTFGATGTASTLLHALASVGGQTVSRITVTLGTPSAAGKTAKGAGTMTWTPAAALLDVAGNVISTAPASESGALDVDF